MKNVDWLSEHLRPYGFQYITIDDGYDRIPGKFGPEGHNWIDAWDPKKYPNGPQWIAGYIKSKGLRPGLWLVPNAYSGAVKTHPDWYLRDAGGKFVRDYNTPTLDHGNPEVLAFLRDLFATLGSWGFEYYKFDGEFKPDVKHDRPGLLSMANAGKGTDGSQFFLTFVETPWLDNNHTIFGEVVEGLDVLKLLEAAGSREGRTSEPLRMEKVTVEVR